MPDFDGFGALLPRRSVVWGAGALLGSAMVPNSVNATSVPKSQVAWSTFQKMFVTADGRVIDTGNKGISHSEGQGIAMLSAASFGDQAAFDLVYDWTQRQLSRPGDALHSWCYNPGIAAHVIDPNNATDGDLLIGLALFTAADRWHEERYHKKGLAIARDVKSALLTKASGSTVLLPGIDGFVGRDGVTVNPSYYVFPALQRFAAELPDPVWHTVWNDGLTLLTRARFGRWSLSPDWASVSGPGDVRIARAWPARCSFDAVRVPLHLCWASLSDHPAVTSFLNYWQHSGGAASPAWSDLNTGQSAPYQLSAGMDAIRRLAMAQRGIGDAFDLPAITADMDYYAAALTLLVHVASTSPPRPSV